MDTKCSECQRRIPEASRARPFTKQGKLCWECSVTTPGRADLSVLAEELVETCVNGNTTAAVDRMREVVKRFETKSAPVAAIIAFDMSEWFASQVGRSPGADMDRFIAVLADQAGLEC